MPTLAAVLWGGYARFISQPTVAAVVSITVIAVNIGLILGGRIWDVPLETDISKLWIDPASEVFQNNQVISQYGSKVTATNNELYTLGHVDGSNMATLTGVDLWANYTSAILDTVIFYEGTAYTVLDVCNGRLGQSPYTFGCSISNPIDYFAEGEVYFPTDAAAQWLLDEKLAYPAYISGTQPTAQEYKKILWNWAIGADSLSVGTIHIYADWFSKTCLSFPRLLCGNNTELLIQVNNLVAGTLPPLPDAQRAAQKVAKFQLSWAKAQLALVAMLSEASSNGGSCSGASGGYDAQTNTDTLAITSSDPAFLYGLTLYGFVPNQTHSFANCATDQVAPGPDFPACASPVSTCSFSDLQALTPLNFSSPCATCVVAAMWWMGELNRIDGSGPTGLPPSSGILSKIPVYTGTNEPGFTIGNTLAIGAADTVRDSVLGTFGCSSGAVNGTSCVYLWNEFYTGTVAALQGLTEITTDTVTRRAEYLGNLDIDALDELKAVTDGGKDAMDASWRALLTTTGAVPGVAPVLYRHRSRKSYKDPATDIPVVLSGFNNDLLTQNLRPAIFGSAVPRAAEMRAGSCQCANGIAGSKCTIARDELCTCNKDTPLSCVSDLLASCASLAGCADWLTIHKLLLYSSAFGNPPELQQYANFENEIKVTAAFTANAPVAAGVLSNFCKFFSPCLDAMDINTLSAIAPSTWEPILQDGSWNMAQFSDGLTGGYDARATLLSSGCAINFLITGAGSDTTKCTNVISSAAQSAIGVGLTATDVGNVAACFESVGTSPTCLADISTAWTHSQASGSNCDVFADATSAQVTIKDYFTCLAQLYEADLTNRKLLWSTGQAAISCSLSNSSAVNPTPGQCKNSLAAALFSGISKTVYTYVLAGNPTDAWNTLMAFGYPIGSIDYVAISTAVAYLVPQGQFLGNQLAQSSNVLNALNSNVFPGGTDYLDPASAAYKAVVDQVLDGACQATLAAPFVTVKVYKEDCLTLVENLGGTLPLPPTAPKNETSVYTIARALAKYPFMGTLFGSCSPSGGDALGGGECWEDADCQTVDSAYGTCNTTNANPFQSIRTFASILFTNDGQGTVGQMKSHYSTYRERANKPIFDRYTQKQAALAGRRLTAIDFGTPGAVDLTADQAKEMIAAWRKKVIDNIYAFRDASTGLDANVVTADSTADLLNSISQADPRILVLGYGLMLLYTFLSCTNWSTDVPAMLNGSRALVGQAGVILVALSVASGLGVSHLAGVPWSAAATQIVPFVLLGLGVSDTFILLRIFPYYQDNMTAEQACVKALTIAGPPMLLVSATNAGVFAIGVLTAMPVVVDFALQSVIIVVANYITTNLMFPALLVLDYKRMGAGRMDTLPCIHVGTSPRAQVHSETSQYETNIFNRCLTPMYAKCITSIPGKIFVLALSFSFLGAAVYGVERVAELGLQLADVAPANSDLSNALLTRDRDFGFYTVNIITPETDWSKREAQQGLVKVFVDAMATSKIVAGSGTPWIQAFMAWGQFKTPSYDPYAVGGYCEETNPMTGGACGDRFDCRVVTADDSVVDGGIPFYSETDFYRCLGKWINHDLTYEALKPGFVLVDEFAERGNRTLYFSRNDSTGLYIPYTTGTIIAQGLSYNSDFVTLITELRAVVNRDTTPPSFPAGEPIDFWDQYVTLSNIILHAIGFSLLICFITIFILLVALVEGDSSVLKRIFATFWASALTTGIIALTVFEIYGYMAWAGLKISAIPAISIIMSTGVAVEYTAYTSVAFVNGAGTMNERAVHCLMLMMAPTIDGAITMFLGVVMLAASPFVFIVKYFFYPWLLIIFFGVFNGLAFLPVLFSLVGPPAVMSAQGKKTIDANSKELATKA